MRRFTRLTNAFSKKVLNLSVAIAVHFVYYIWTIDVIVKLLDPNRPTTRAGNRERRLP